jgi:ketosteroid isomerase-like protein
MNRIPLVAIVALSVVLGGCSPQDSGTETASGPCSLPPADIEAIRSMEANHGAQVLAGDFDAMQTDLAEDVVVIFPNQKPIVGRAAVREFQGQFPPMDAYDYQVDEVFGCGDMALARGTYSMAMWRDMGNSDRPPEQP